MIWGENLGKMCVVNPSLRHMSIYFMQQMDDAVYTFEQLLHQSLEGQEGEDLCKTIQRCQDRVIKVKQKQSIYRSAQSYLFEPAGPYLRIFYFLNAIPRNMTMTAARFVRSSSERLFCRYSSLTC